MRESVVKWSERYCEGGEEVDQVDTEAWRA